MATEESRGFPVAEPEQSVYGIDEGVEFSRVAHEVSVRERLLRVLVRDDLPQVRVEVLQPVYHCCRCMRQLPFAGRLQPSSADPDPADADAHGSKG